mmetsp:Transcript_60421/g.174330  ORF Transcript_60421/g.174330 Transcript_60421/m.174330 type:complete len:306 (-) Transcript_60421:2-919(-)
MSSLKFFNASAAMRWAALREPITVVSDMVRQKRCGDGMKFNVCSRPSTRTTTPALPICLHASPANLTTSPCVSFATVGMFAATFGCLSSVFAISETRASMPRPLMRMSHWPSNWPNSNIPVHCAKLSAVRQSGVNSLPLCSQYVAASNVSERKQLPFDQVVAPESLDFILSTVVPLPVPLRPTKITTQPPSFGNWSMISCATSSALLPMTSTDLYCGGARSPGRTPFLMASSTPSCSFSPSSSSRFTMRFNSRSDNSLNVASSFKNSMIAPEVLSSCAFSTSAVRDAILQPRLPPVLPKNLSRSC